MKELPHNLEVEQALLGAILVNNDVFERISNYLRPEHFANNLHGEIYGECLRRFEQDITVTPITLKPHFQDHEELKEVGGAKYFSKLAASAITIINADDYGRLIQELAIRRNLINISKNALEQSYDTSQGNINDIIAEIENSIHETFNEHRSDQSLIHISKSNTEALESVIQAMNHDGAVVGVTTGSKALDEATGGLSGGQLIILAGRPKMGKTTKALSIATGAALAGKNVGFFSIEMASPELSLRLASSLCFTPQRYVPYFKALNGDLTDGDYQLFRQGMTKADQLPLYITDTGGRTVASVRLEMRRLRRKLQREGKTLDLVVIDYLQLMNSSSRYKGNRVQEITEITRGLKELAKEYNVPILTLSQLSRSLESREDKRPILSDLRESGSIEQDADLVMFVYREYEYIKDKEPKKNVTGWMADCDKLKNRLDLIIAAQRRGPTKTIPYECYLHSNVIKDL